MRDTITVPAALFKKLFDYGNENPDLTVSEAGEAKQLANLCALPRLHIEGRRWYSKRLGNTYHSVRVHANNETLWASGKEYGYGDQYLTTAFVWLQENRPDLIPGYNHSNITIYLREVVQGTYSVADVEKEKYL